MEISPLEDVVSIDQDRMGGEPCFKGTRVPVKTLFDHIGKLDEFFDGFPSVTHEQVDKVLSFAGQLKILAKNLRGFQNLGGL